jgi:chromosome segregation and condensation protein ScpB
MSNFTMYQEKLRKQRENPETSRAGLKWEVEEDNALINKIDENVNIEDIAKQLQRTSGSIKTRLIVKALTLIDEDHSITLDQAAEKYKITTQDIQAYQANKKKRQLTNSLRNNPVNLNMIYALLVEINNKLS